MTFAFCQASPAELPPRKTPKQDRGRLAEPAAARVKGKEDCLFFFFFFVNVRRWTAPKNGLISSNRSSVRLRSHSNLSSDFSPDAVTNSLRILSSQKIIPDVVCFSDNSRRYLSFVIGIMQRDSSTARVRGRGRRTSRTGPDLTGPQVQQVGMALHAAGLSGSCAQWLG